MEPDSVEIRVVGCLLEKQRTTPDVYPLSLNALRLACNQATNRDPVVEYDEATVREALKRLALRGWTRLASGPGSRAPKYRQLFDEALGLEPDEAALLAILMLRGTQTPGELKQRSDRLHHFANLAAVYEALERLIQAGHVARLDRRPGQKEERYVQLLGGGGAETPVGSGVGNAHAVAPSLQRPALEQEPAPEGHQRATQVRVGPSSEDRLERLERELGELRQQVQALRLALGDTTEPTEL